MDARAEIASIFARHQRVFLSFSGGKDSLTVAHLCEPWRDRLTLVWTNTGHMAPFMADFVRSHWVRYDLIELTPERPMLEQWAEHGVPVDLLPVEYAEGVGYRQPRLQAWPLCCEVHRNIPVRSFLANQDEPCAFLTGQRRSDNGATVAGLKGVLPAHIEVAQPLWDWSDADVLAYVAEHDIALHPHHATCATSVECIVCPANLSAEKMRLLDDHYPDASAYVRATLKSTLGIALAKAAEIAACVHPQPSEASHG